MTVHDRRMEAVLAKLQSDRDRPIPAIELADYLGGVNAALTFGDMAHETKRRRIREIVDDLRKVGYRICAGFMPGGDQGEGGVGYWMARDTAEWNHYLESRKSAARFEFVVLKKFASAASEKQSGQGSLFGSRDPGTEPRKSTEWARV